MDTVQTKTARVIAVFGTKGGVGKTLIATNLAATLTAQQIKTALVELESSHADAKTMLGACGVHLVSEAVTQQSLPALMGELRNQFEYVFIDAGSVLHELAATAFEQSNLILLVTTPDLVSLRHGRSSRS